MRTRSPAAMAAILLRPDRSEWRPAAGGRRAPRASQPRPQLPHPVPPHDPEAEPRPGGGRSDDAPAPARLAALDVEAEAGRRPGARPDHHHVAADLDPVAAVVRATVAHPDADALARDRERDRNPDRPV